MSRWNPWRALRSRSHITFALHRLPPATGGAVYGRRGDRVAIIVDTELSPGDRAAALAHELVHDERGPPPAQDDVPMSFWPVIIREEGHVERIVAARLVPLDALAAYVDTLVEIGESVTALEVADEFDVPMALAGRALGLLRDAA